MEFLETAWKGFRNLRPSRQKWCQGLNVLFGQNGSGKTNILESMNFLCGWGAFSGGKTQSVIAWNELAKRAFLLGLTGGERDIEIKASIGVSTSLAASNDRVTHSALRSLIPSLSFLPRDIDLIDGSPSVRRLFIDKLCVLCSPLYARRLSEYKQLVRHKAVLLKRRQAVRATNVPLAKLGGWIWDKRREAVRALALKLAAENELLPCDIQISLESKGLLNGEIYGVERDIERDGERDMVMSLNAASEREWKASYPLVGPHRDDISITYSGRTVSSSLSRGQKKRTVMALIVSAGRVIEAILRVKPIMILDDVAAELDSTGRDLLGKTLVSTGWQVFISGVDDPFGHSDGARWRIQDGEIFVI